MVFNVNNSQRPRLNYSITVPQNIPFNPPATLRTTASTLTVAPTALNIVQPRTETSSCLSDVLNAIINFFKFCFSCFGLFSRESKLQKQMRYAQEQMNREPAKNFIYTAAPADWAFRITNGNCHAHEERVGNLSVGICHAQGRRPAMEDAHLATQFNIRVGCRDYPVQLFGVFDGHGGSLVSSFIQAHLQHAFQHGCMPHSLSDDEEIARALKMACIRINRELLAQHGPSAQHQGSTATIAMILDGKLWTINVGDSRTVLDNNGTPIQLSEDANPEDPRHRRGIERRGGQVIDVGGVMRINGQLAVGRAFGDFSLNGAISASPKITMKPLSEIRANGHLILCCDGVYDVARTTDIVRVAHDHRNLSAGELAKNIVYSAWNSGSGDNLSALVVKIP